MTATAIVSIGFCLRSEKKLYLACGWLDSLRSMRICACRNRHRLPEVSFSKETSPPEILFQVLQQFSVRKSVQCRFVRSTPKNRTDRSEQRPSVRRPIAAVRKRRVFRFLPAGTYFSLFDFFRFLLFTCRCLTTSHFWKPFLFRSKFGHVVVLQLNRSHRQPPKKERSGFVHSLGPAHARNKGSQVDPRS